MTNASIKVHEKTFEMAWGDMDALGHMNNARYFDYFQEARIDWLQHMNLPLNREIGPVLVHVACTFLKPVVYPAFIHIVSAIKNIGTSSLLMDHQLYQGATLMAEGVSKVVWVHYAQNKPLPLPEAIRALADS